MVNSVGYVLGQKKTLRVKKERGKLWTLFEDD